MNTNPPMPLSSLIHDHSRHFQEMKYVYPVISRRSAGLSIGVNLSLVGQCNFACVYCQILGERQADAGGRLPVINSRSSPWVDLPRMEQELRDLVGMVNNGSLFEDSKFSVVSLEERTLRNIAFSGDGEPTLSPQFSEAVQRIVAVRRELCSQTVKIVLITNATNLAVPNVLTALQTLHANNGEIWAKLDAGTDQYYRSVSRSAVPYDTVLNNLTATARKFPLVIQTCFFLMHGIGPTEAEIHAYIDRIRSILVSGGVVDRIQMYTIARTTPEPWACPLDKETLDNIAETVRMETGLKVSPFA